MSQSNASYRLTNLDASFLYQESAVSQMHGGLISPVVCSIAAVHCGA